MSNLAIVVWAFLGFLALPVLAYVVTKMVALGWRRGNQIFDDDNQQQEREQDGIDQKRA